MTNTYANKTNGILLSTEEELFNSIIPNDHPFRKLENIIDFDELLIPLEKCYSNIGTVGIAIEKGFKALLVQFWEDYSDRQMERAIRENIAVRWFCGFRLTDETPDHSYFGKLRKRIGVKNIANSFNKVNEILREKGLFGDTFTFLDASAIITKTALWEERDKAIKDGEEKLNNAVVNKYTADKQAKWGAKSKNNVWFGYKRHNAVDMRYGLISKVKTTPANVLDFKVVKNICPNQGMVFADKLYDCKEANNQIKIHGCKPATIRKNNNPNKNNDLDKWRSKIRMPFESTFSKQSKRAKYKGLSKTTFQCFTEAIIYNLKKAVKILPLQTTPT